MDQENRKQKYFKEYTQKYNWTHERNTNQVQGR